MRSASALIPVQAHELTSLALVRLPLRSGAGQIGQALLFPQFFAPLRAHRRLGVLSLRLGRRATAFRQSQDLKLRDHALQRLTDKIADAHQVRRLDALAVLHRQDAREGLAALHREHGQALVFFPEGTFSEQVGLLRFHIGAFAAAARADIAVIPVAIRGTRWCLPPGQALPRPGPIEVQVLAALPHAGADAVALRDAARAALLAQLGEPDLAGSQPDT